MSKGEFGDLAVFAHLHHPAYRVHRGPGFEAGAELLPPAPGRSRQPFIAHRISPARSSPPPKQHRAHRLVEGDDPHDQGLHRQTEPRQPIRHDRGQAERHAGLATPARSRHSAPPPAPPHPAGPGPAADVDRRHPGQRHRRGPAARAPRRSASRSSAPAMAKKITKTGTAMRWSICTSGSARTGATFSTRNPATSRLRSSSKWSACAAAAVANTSTTAKTTSSR